MIHWLQQNCTLHAIYIRKKHCLLHIYLCAENFRYNICILKCMRYMPSRHSIYLVIPWISANYETTTETGDLNRQTIKWGPTTNPGIINLVFNESFCKRLSQILILSNSFNSLFKLQSIKIGLGSCEAYYYYYVISYLIEVLGRS